MVATIFFEDCVRLASDHKHTADGQPVSAGVNEMCFHRKAFALDKVLTRMMEMELLQRVAAVTQAERVTFGEVKLNGVAVVNNLIWPFDPARWLPRGDVDG